MRAGSFASALLLTLSGCADYPRDTEGTLERVRGRAMRLGVVAGDADPAYAALAGELARRTGARVDRRVGAAEPLLQELEKGRVDLVVGTYDRSTPWDARVTFSKPVSRWGEREVKAATMNGEHAWAMEVDRAVAALEKRR